MKKLTIGLTALAIATAGAGAAFADNHKGMDDGDGVLTRSEAQAHAEQMFTRMDANKDGKLDATDREARREQRRANMFAALDADNNGQISRTEFMTFEHEGMGMRGKWGEGREGGHHARKRGMGMMKMADTNGDGGVSKAEFTAAAMKRFDMADADNDGKITREERHAAHKEMRAKWRERAQAKSAE